MVCWLVWIFILHNNSLNSTHTSIIYTRLWDIG